MKQFAALLMTLPLTACGGVASSTAQSIANVVQVSASDLWSGYAEIVASGDLPYMKEELRAGNILTSYDNILAQISDDIVVIDGQTLAGVKERFADSRAHFEALDARYGSIGEYLDGEALNADLVSESDLNDKLSYLSGYLDQTSFELRSTKFALLDEVQSCRDAALAKHSCSAIGQALGSDGKPVEEAKLYFWSAAGRGLSRVINGVSKALPTIRAASDLCSAVAEGVRSAKSCDEANKVADDTSAKIETKEGVKIITNSCINVSDCKQAGNVGGNAEL